MVTVSMFSLEVLRMCRRILPMRFVVIHGYYGEENVGDEAILASTLKQVRSVTGLEPVVFAWGPDRVSRDFGVRSLNPNGRDRRKAFAVLMQSKAYILGGGGLIKDYGGSPASLERWLRWPELAQVIGVRTMLWSVGVENVTFEESKARVREVLGCVDVVTVRDPASEGRLREIGVDRPIVVTADPVPHFVRHTMRSIPPAERAGGDREDGAPILRRIAVCPRHWYVSTNRVADAAAFDELLSAFARTLDYAAEQWGCEVEFVPLRTSEGDDDREVCAAIAARMESPATLAAVAPSVEGVLERIASSDLLIAMRLHATIMATALGIPTIAVAYMPKVADYMASIQQSAFCERVEDATASWMVDRVKAIASGYGELADSLGREGERLAERYEENGRFLASLIRSS